MERIKNRSQLLLWAVIAALAAVNVLLLQQNLEMRAEIEKSKPVMLQSGATVDGFNATGLRGEQISIGYTGRETTRVLLFFTPSCPYCQEQFPYWNELRKQLNANQFQVLGVVGEKEDKANVERFLRSVGGEDLPVAFVQKEVLREYKLSSTPTTLVIANNGTVQQAWAGKWHTDTLKAVNATFNLSLPQL